MEVQKEVEIIKDVKIVRIKGKKEDKEFNFLVVTMELGDKEFNLYPKKEKSELFNYLLQQEVE